MEETGVLENRTLLSLVLPDFEPGPNLGMVQKRPFSGNTGLSARTLIGPALERVDARSWLPCWWLQLRANRV